MQNRLRSKQVKEPVPTRKVRAKDRKSKLNKWAHGDAKSNVGEYRT